MLLLAMIQGRSDVMAQLSPKTECGKTSVSLPGQGSELREVSALLQLAESAFAALAASCAPMPLAASC